MNICKLKTDYTMHASKPLKIAVVGSGIAGLSAAWHLSQQTNVEITVFEKMIGLVATAIL